MKRRLFAALLPCLLCPTSRVLAWGASGHKLVNRVAVETMNSDLAALFQNNSDNLQRLANVPDVLWKRPATKEKEKFAHFFQWDKYRSSAIATQMPIPIAQAMRALGNQYLVTNGTAVWRVDQLYKMLVAAIRSEDWTRTLQIAGVMGHYVGDLSQPMHVTADYDGQSIQRQGIHSYFETVLLDKQDRNDLHNQVWQIARTESNIEDQDTNPVGIAFAEGKLSLTRLAGLIDTFAAANPPDDDALAPFLAPSIATGASTLRTLWDRASVEANIRHSIPANHLTVADPQWIPLEIEPITQ